MVNPIREMEAPKKICQSCGSSFEMKPGLEVCPTDGGTLIELVDDTPIGSFIVQRYQLKALIGTGGNGSVYSAIDHLTDELVAVKVMHKHLVASKDSLARFKREATTLQAIAHPHLARVYDSGFLPNGLPYMVMEYLEGQTLDELVAKEGKLSAKHAEFIIGQVCEALACAHSKGVVHRDMKPGNILLLPNYEVKVLDFGLAKHDDTTEGALTTTGHCVGTPQYMSPEQCMGANVDARSDIYSLGLIIFEILTGRRAMEDATVFETMQKHVDGKVPTLAEVRPDLSFAPGIQIVLNKCLAKDPKQRFATCTDLERAFLEALHGSLTPIKRRFPWQKCAAAASVAVVAIAGWYGIQMQLKKNAAAQPEPEGLTSSVNYPPKASFGVQPPAVRALNMRAWPSDTIEKRITTLTPEQRASVKEIDVSSSDVTDAIALSILQQFPDVERLKMSRTLVHDKICAQLGSSKLVALDVSHTYITDKGFSQLLQAKGLNSLEAHGLKITDAGAAGLKGRDFAILGLSRTLIGDATLVNIGAMTGLHALIIEDVPVSATGVAPIAGCRNLEWLDLQGTKTNNATVEKVVSNMPALSFLSVGSTQATTDFLPALEKAKHLSYLDISQLKVTSPVVPALLKLKGLKRVKFNKLTDEEEAELTEAGIRVLKQRGLGARRR